MPDYNSKDVDVIITNKESGASIIASGFVSDSRVGVVKNEDAVSVAIGSDGEWAFEFSNDESGLITLHLMQTSATNDFLSSQYQLQRLQGGGLLEVMVKDNNGRSLHYAPDARIQKIPDSDYGPEIESREWPLICPKIEDFVGGS